MSAPPRPELHRPVPLDRIGRLALEREVVADPAECAAVAARLLIPAVLALACRFVLRREAGEGTAIAATGALSARVVRDCVVSLEPFETDITEHFALRFVPEGTESEDDDPASVDEIGYAQGAIDLGETAVQQLALALDPFPRNPQSRLPDPGPEAAENPFMRALRDRKP